MHLTSFLNYLKHEKRYSPHTLRNYESDLTQFFNYLSALTPPVADEEVKLRHLRGWMTQLALQPLQARSIGRKAATLKSYYKFLLQKGYRTTNPTEGLLQPKTPKRLAATVEEKRMDNLLDNIEFATDFKGRRDRLVIELLYGLGIRESELVNLTAADMNTATERLPFWAKEQRTPIALAPTLLRSHRTVSRSEASRTTASDHRNAHCKQQRWKSVCQAHPPHRNALPKFGHHGQKEKSPRVAPHFCHSPPQQRSRLERHQRTIGTQ